MRPKTTWVLLANSRTAQAVACKRAFGKLEIEPQMGWHAKPELEYADRPGVSHGSHSPSRRRLAQHDSTGTADLEFAKSIVADLMEAHREKLFDRLVVTASHHMLGALRTAQSDEMKSLVTAEKAVDLTQAPRDKLEEHIAELIAP